MLSDPFADHEDRESSTITSDDTFKSKREYAIAPGLCNARISVDNKEPLSFNGEPVKVPITVTTNDKNTVNCSTGVFVFINRLAQEVSTDGINFNYMAVFTEPGTAFKRELYFKPSILPEDAGKDKLGVSFANCENVCYHLNPQKFHTNPDGIYLYIKAHPIRKTTQSCQGTNTQAVCSYPVYSRPGQRGFFSSCSLTAYNKFPGAQHIFIREIVWVAVKTVGTYAYSLKNIF